MAGAGSLDRRIELQSATYSYDVDYNERTETWATYATVWAQIRYLAEGERVSADKWFAENVVTFRVRYRSDITTAHHIIYSGQTFEIRGTREIGRREYIDISARLIQ